MPIKIPALFFFLLHTLLQAQNCQLVLQGRISDADSHEALDFTTVYIIELNKGVQANEKGGYILPGLCKGRYTLKISHTGCRDSLITVEIKDNTRLNIKLPHSYNELATVEIKEKSEQLHTGAYQSLHTEDMEKSRGQTLGDALKQLNGVTTYNTGTTIAKPMIHGLQGYRILILNNGIRLEGQQWGNEHAPEIDPFMATKLSVIKGAGAIRYGNDAIAGVILVEPDDLPDTASVSGQINLVGFSNGQQGVASGIVQGCFEKLKGWNWRIQGTLKQGGNVQTPDYYLRNTGIKEQNFSYASGYHRKHWGAEIFYSQFNTQIGIFSGSHIGNLTDLQSAFQQSKPRDSLATFSYAIARPAQNISHELVKANVHIHTGLRSRLHANVAWQYNVRQEYDKHLFYNQSLSDSLKNTPQLDYRITSKTAELIWEHDNIRGFRGQYGASYMNQYNVYLGRFFIPNYINNTWGAFASERMVRTRYEVEAGLRYDEKYLQSYYYDNNVLQKPSLRFNNLSWNTGFIWKADTSFHVHANLGSAWRAPAVNELYSNGLHHGAGAIERGDKNLQTERAYSAIITFLFKRKYVSAELSPHYNYIHHFIYQNPAPYPELTIKGAFPVFYYRQANVRIAGLDARVSIQLHKQLLLESKAMWLRSYNYSINNYLIYMPSDRFESMLKYTLKKHGCLKETVFSAGAQYITKQWRVPQGLDFAPPPPAYLLVNADVNTTVKWARQEIIMGIGVYNLLNTAYRDYLDRFRYYCDGMGRNVQLRIKVPFTIYDKK